MKKWLWFLCALLLLPVLCFSQGIRKNYSEMTSAEKDAYVFALNALSNSDPTQDIVQTLSSYYFDHYDDFYNSPCSSNQYLYFRRMMLWEMENAFQHINPKLTIPYWDWSANSSPSPDDPLLNSFLSLSNIPSQWDVWREINYDGTGGTLPLSYDVAWAENLYTFCDDNDPMNSFATMAMNIFGYSPDFWIGGTLGMHDPKDPLFFLSSAMGDKLWQDWQKANSGSWVSLYGIDRYDGSTNGVYVSPLPYADPNSITDSRTLGIFYANNGTVNLDGNYQVQNTYMNPENFSYPGQIVVSTFNVPSGKNAVITSATGVELTPGFFVDGGNLEIDVGSNYYDGGFALSKKGLGGRSLSQEKNPAIVGEDKVVIARSSHGFIAHLQLQNPSEVQGFVVGLDGKIVSRLQGGHLESGPHDFDLNIPQGGGGLYYGYFRIGDQTYKRLLPRL